MSSMLFISASNFAVRSRQHGQLLQKLLRRAWENMSSGQQSSYLGAVSSIPRAPRMGRKATHVFSSSEQNSTFFQVITKNWPIAASKPKMWLHVGHSFSLQEDRWKLLKTPNPPVAKERALANETMRATRMLSRCACDPNSIKLRWCMQLQSCVWPERYHVAHVTRTLSSCADVCSCNHACDPNAIKLRLQPCVRTERYQVAVTCAVATMHVASDSLPQPVWHVLCGLPKQLGCAGARSVKSCNNTWPSVSRGPTTY